MRHARAATIDEVENNYISKQVMNTAQVHWNEEILRGSPLGDGRLVFGLITGSMTIGLASQDTAENAIAELGLDRIRFRKPVHHGDTITAYTEVLAVEDADDHDDAGVVRFHHWGLNQHGDVVCELERSVLVKRRSHWKDRQRS
jgi:acyl dehydratase